MVFLFAVSTLLLRREPNTVHMRRMMFFGLSLIMGGLTEAAVRHSGQYLECSRGDCQMLGDSEVDFCHLIKQNIL